MTGPTHRLDRLGFTVRADWPDGSHDIFSWRRNWYAAWRLARRARVYWQAGPATPHTWAILTATRRQIRTHRPGCRQPTCQRGSIAFRDDQHARAPVRREPDGRR